MPAPDLNAKPISHRLPTSAGQGSVLEFASIRSRLFSVGAILGLAAFFALSLGIVQATAQETTPTPELPELPLAPTPTPFPGPSTEEGPQVLSQEALSLLEPNSSPDLIIGSSATDDLRPHAAYDQTSGFFLVVWQDLFPGGPVDVFGRYVSPAGGSVGTSFPVVADRTGPLETRVGGGGNVFLVAWREGPDPYAGPLYGQLVQASPVALPRLIGQPFVIHDPIGQMFTLAYNRELNEFVVAWIDRRHPSLGPLLRGEVYARRVSPQGELLGQEVNLTPVGINPSFATIISAPGIQAEISLAFNPKTANVGDGEYLLTYGNYDCTTLSCTVREDVRGQRLDAVTLAQAGGVIRFTSGITRTQWNARAVFNETEGEYVVVWDDSRVAEGDFEIRRQRMTAGGVFILGSVILAGGEGSQVKPDIVPLLGEAPLPRYIVVWQDDAVSMEHSTQGLFLDALALPVGGPFALSSVLHHNQYLPQVASDARDPGTLLAVWQHGPVPDDADIHGQVMSSVEAITITDTSPADWAMVLSLRPTFRWPSFEGAATYRLTIYGLQNPIVADLDADQTADPDSPGRERWKLSADLSSGTTLNDAGYHWTVEALDASGQRLAGSLLTQFQIPPLGLNPANDQWNRFDDLIYLWSEARDLPPALVKAVLAKETGGIHSYLDNGDPPEDSYLYEPRRDYFTCVEGGPPNACFDSRVAPYKQPGAGTECPRQLCSVNGTRWDDNPSIADMAADPTEPWHPGAGISNTGSLQTLTGCSQWPFSGRSFFECVVDWFGGSEDVPVAQYRLMASYGLGQVTYWQNFRRDALDPYKPAPGTAAPPETLYRPDVNIQVTTQLLSDKRCAWQRFDSHEVHDPLIPDYIFLNAANFDPSQYALWRQTIPAYNGYAFYSPQGIGAQRYFNRVGDFYLGQNQETSTQPVDLSSGGGSIFPAEGAPPQFYQGLGDTVPQRCPLPGSQAMSVTSLRSAVPVQQSLLAGQVVLDEEFVDFEGDGVPERSVLVWTGDPEANPLGTATVRIHDPSNGDILVWESPSMQEVTTDGLGHATAQPASARQLLQLDWPTGAHGTLTYFIGSFGEDFGFVPVIQPDDLRFDFAESDAGGAGILPDGSLAVLQRGDEAPLAQTFVDIYVFDGSAFRWARTYLLDQNVVDTNPPTTQALVEPAANPQGWVQPPAWVVLSARDDNALRFIEFDLANTEGSLQGVTALDEYQIPLGEGRWSLTYSSLDGYGNEETPRRLDALVDGTAPVTEAQVEGSEGSDGWYATSVLVTLIGSDPALADGSDGSGVASVEYSLDGGLTWEPYQAPLTLDQEGMWTILYKARDEADNEEEPKELEVKIEGQGPVVSVSIEPSVLWPPNNKPVSVTLTGSATDPGGILRIEFEVIDEYAEWEPVLEALTPPAGGEAVWQFSFDLLASRKGDDQDGRLYLIRVIAYDVSGNSTETEAIVKVPHDQSK